jgi:hypothetical protein
LKKKDGPICAFSKVQTMVKKIIEPAKRASSGKSEPGVQWKQNALRHSFGSYRLPALNDAPKLALEMGNSPAMIFRHYRELVKPAEAEKFWAIMPPNDYAEKMVKALAVVPHVGKPEAATKQ